ncbi:YjdF family protein [Clostridium boliviensis]|uniref:YjdF family protein n=1 Tax=Clostridium boliviensis TaxID=318465 RepID=A0ABU4GIK5_9CLOT|nr:YjdF family protein [Clostridium boliviensis]MDW2797439.1 YjdF family protein [Clostridium boliviensis]
MDKVSVRFSVFFEEPFWVGILERETDGKLSVSKVTFGAEPKDYEVNEFLRKNYYRLRFSPAVEASVKASRRNPKRILREVRRQIQNTGISTKSQQALKLQQEEGKLERKLLSREARETKAQQRFEQKQQKKKEKHRGR